MQSRGCLLFPFMMFFMLLHCNVAGAPQRPHVVRPASWGALEVKLRRLEDPRVTENEVMELKRRRSFSGTNTSLDRISVGAMETKQRWGDTPGVSYSSGSPERSIKAAALPRRRVSPPPIDRIGISRLPSRRG
ncbi:osteocrin isoform 2-T5 [Spinachia spinachia]